MLIILPALAASFYLPGVAPNEYQAEEKVPLLVNALTAKDSLLPFDYYHPGFDFCRPEEVQSQRESLGSILFGDRLFTSPFELFALKNEHCKVLCKKNVNEYTVEFMQDRIAEEYSYNWVVDGLPAAQVYKDDSYKDDKSADAGIFYIAGVPLGVIEFNSAFLNNHYNIIIKYHEKEATGKIRVTGVIVNPVSMTEATQNNHCGGVSAERFVLPFDNKPISIQYTYSVEWEKDDKSWGTRWDHYLHVYDPQIHWFSIVNSIVIVLILSSMVAMILLRALHKDISRYNTLGDEDAAADDFGWKTIHADVFRAPTYRMLLCVLLGTGSQLLCMLAVTLAFAVLGFLSPSSRGSLGTMALIFFVFFSSVSGYVSSYMYKVYQGENRKQNVMLTAFLVPGIIFGIFIILNFVLISHQSSSAVPFGTLMALIGMWFLVSVPLCVIGAYFGFRRIPVEPPCKVNQIPRQIPPQPWYLSNGVYALIGGILPFGAIFIELFFIMSSIWSHRLYYMFGFLMFVFVILVLTCCLVSILLTYFALCAEDYLWVWKSFFASAASGLYIFLYSIVFFARKMDFKDSASTFIYFSWSAVMSIMFSILAGTVGHFASFVFVRKIYKAIKVD